MHSILKTARTFGLSFIIACLAGPSAALASGVAIIDADILGADLHLELDYAAHGGGIGIEILIDASRTGASVASTSVDLPVGGTSIDIVVPDVVTAIPAHGLGYQARVLALDGTEIATPLPFRQRLRCPTGTSCHVEIDPGVDVPRGVVAVPEAVAEAVGDALSDGSWHVDLTALVAARPDLRGDLYGLLFELGETSTSTAVSGAAPAKTTGPFVDGGLTKSGNGVPPGCSCAWVAGVDDGGLRRVSVEAVDGPTTASSTGAYAELSIELACFEPPQPGSALTLPGGTILEPGDLTGLTLCANLCPSAVTPSLETVIGVAAGAGEVDTEVGVSTVSSGSLALRWTVDGAQQTLDSLVAANTHAPFDDPAVYTVVRPVNHLDATRTAPLDLRLDVTLTATAWISSAAGGWSIGEAAIGAGTKIEAQLSSSCVGGRPATLEVMPLLYKIPDTDYVTLLDGNP